MVYSVVNHMCQKPLFCSFCSSLGLAFNTQTTLVGNPPRIVGQFTDELPVRTGGSSLFFIAISDNRKLNVNTG